MEWISVTAKSLPEAIDLVLDNLGVDESEAEIVVVEEPKQGFFGRAKGLARVEARVKPIPAKGHGNRNRKRNNSKPVTKRKNSNPRNSKPSSDKQKTSNKVDSNMDINKDTPIDEVSSFLNDYMLDLTRAFGYEDDVVVEGDENSGLTVSVKGQNGLMVGHNGRTLNAIQELIRVSTQRSKPSQFRIYVDVGDYRKKRAEALSKFATEAAKQAMDQGADVVLDPMSSADRKIIHDALSEMSGVETRSAGVEPRRRVIVVPTSVNSTSG